MKSSAVFISLSLLLTSSVLGTSISRNGRCGEEHGGTACPSSRSGPGSCCSSYGWCGRTDNHCLAERGCQSAFGSCIHPYVAPRKKISPDGSCGGKKGYTCQGSSFGDCCSQYGWCGRTPAYCASGCQNPFGICKETATASSCTKSSTSTRSPAHITTQSSSISATITPGSSAHLHASSSTSCTASVKASASSSASSSSSAHTSSMSSSLRSSSTSSTTSPSGSMPTASSLVITPASSSDVVTSMSSDSSLSTSELATTTSSGISITTSNPITPTSSDIPSSTSEPVTPTSSESSVSTSDSATPTSSDTLSSTPSSDTIISTSLNAPTPTPDPSPSSSTSPTPSPSSSTSPTPTPTQAVVNPGFEDPSTAPWILFPSGYEIVNTGDPQYGLKTPRVQRTQGLFASIRQVPTILPGTYLVEFSIKVEGPDPSKCQIELTGIAENVYGPAPNSDWNTYSYTLTSAGSKNQFIRIVVSCTVTPQSGYVYFDNITVKPIS